MTIFIHIHIYTCSSMVASSQYKYCSIMNALLVVATKEENDGGSCVSASSWLLSGWEVNESSVWKTTRSTGRQASTRKFKSVLEASTFNTT